MDCKAFRDRHLAFVDNTMGEAELVAMQRHIMECERCARHDVAVRRGLMVFRSLPLIEPSADFSTRLHAKLRQLRQADARAAMFRGPGLGSFLAVAASVVAAGFFAVAAFDWDEPARNLTLAPVVASAPAVAPPPMVSPTYVASATAGIPVLPAVMLAEQAPMHFLESQLRLASWMP